MRTSAIFITFLIFSWLKALSYKEILNNYDKEISKIRVNKNLLLIIEREITRNLESQRKLMMDLCKKNKKESLLISLQQTLAQDIKTRLWLQNNPDITEESIKNLSSSEKEKIQKEIQSKEIEDNFSKKDSMPTSKKSENIEGPVRQLISLIKRGFANYKTKPHKFISLIRVRFANDKIKTPNINGCSNETSIHLMKELNSQNLKTQETSCFRNKKFYDNFIKINEFIKNDNNVLDSYEKKYKELKKRKELLITINRAQKGFIYREISMFFGKTKDYKEQPLSQLRSKLNILDKIHNYSKLDNTNFNKDNSIYNQTSKKDFRNNIEPQNLIKNIETNLNGFEKLTTKEEERIKKAQEEITKKAFNPHTKNLKNNNWQEQNFSKTNTYDIKTFSTNFNLAGNAEPSTNSTQFFTTKLKPDHQTRKKSFSSYNNRFKEESDNLNIKTKAIICVTLFIVALTLFYNEFILKEKEHPLKLLLT